MTNAAAGETKRSAGRPRDANLDLQLMQTTRDLLAEVGFEALSIDAVSNRSGIPRSTIYRRWSSKIQLVIDALAPLAPVHKIEDPSTGSLRDDLVNYFDPAHVIYGNQGPGLFLAIVVAIPANPELKRMWLDRFQIPVIKQLQTFFDHAIERGEIPNDLDTETVISIIPAMIWRRRIFETETRDLSFVKHLIDDIVMPVALSPSYPKSKSASKSRRRTVTKR